MKKQITMVVAGLMVCQAWGLEIGIWLGRMQANRETRFRVQHDLIGRPAPVALSGAEVRWVVMKATEPCFRSEPQDYLEWLERTGR